MLHRKRYIRNVFNIDQTGLFYKDVGKQSYIIKITFWLTQKKKKKVTRCLQELNSVISHGSIISIHSFSICGGRGDFIEFMYGEQ